MERAQIEALAAHVEHRDGDGVSGPSEGDWSDWESDTDTTEEAEAVIRLMYTAGLMFQATTMIIDGSGRARQYRLDGDGETLLRQADDSVMSQVAGAAEAARGEKEGVPLPGRPESLEFGGSLPNPGQGIPYAPVIEPGA